MSNKRQHCHYPMAGGRRCGRWEDHPMYHQSEESLAKKAAEANQKTRERRAVHGNPPSRLPEARREARLANRGQALEVPLGLLPGSALASLVKYKQSGMVRPGDRLYEKIARKLVERELAKVS